MVWPPQRADLFLVQHGYFETRAKAQAAIAAGGVTADGVVISKPSQKIADGAAVVAEAAHPYVSRAALKLVAGLDAFQIDPAGKTCLDVGASTGGFTQVLLERGATRVHAVDVGHGQLHPDVAGDPRVLNLEGQDARTLDATRIGEPPALIVCDASFIGLAKVLERPLGLAADTCDLVALIKPQFEVGRENLHKKGIVRDAAARESAIAAVRRWLDGRSGFQVRGMIESPITGGDGNVEFLITARKQGL
ncbi:TlyA family RNA methyltransferase [Hyphobacterium marinum]|uniref:TlyA family RNA methyltransferase n=1 Tax=Hyphobacterium marinum TaxID=3116574 RepID=A0ABU7M1I6_9PROT|nr:TlyA family RNA methyltransferase [Hyphobacterium sp. Y6023]MEE2567392.1 TlyA family RNA methyltransferase [Hyphobacterium sp. Y6023]